MLRGPAVLNAGLSSGGTDLPPPTEASVRIRRRQVKLPINSQRWQHQGNAGYEDRIRSMYST